MAEIGSSVQRKDSFAKVTGAAQYPGDLLAADQLVLKVLFAGRPHARILSIDTTIAEQQDNVLAILTARDVPNNEYGLMEKDQPVLCGPGSSKPGADKVRCEGDQVALVIAETEEAAEEALRSIIVDYEDLPVVTDMEKAMAEDAPLIHEDKPGNLVREVHVKRGAPEQAFHDADVIVEGVYETPCQEHAYLQPESGMAYLDEEGRITVCVAGQCAQNDVYAISHALDVPMEQVRVIYPAIGGAFGGREDMSVQIILALAVQYLAQWEIYRPVRIVWSREESIIGHHKRHPFKITTRWAATQEGKILGAEYSVLADGGAYASTSGYILINAILHLTGPYDMPNVSVDGYAVYTNNILNGAFRGFGGPQAVFAVEGQMEKLADALNLDPVEVRMRNAMRDGSYSIFNTEMSPGVSIREVISRTAERAGWESSEQGWQRPLRTSYGEPDEPYLKRGLGFASIFKNVGYTFGARTICTARIELHGGEQIEEAVVYHAAPEVGQGAISVIAQMAAEELGVPYDLVRVVTTDTAVIGDSGPSSASRMTFMAGHSIKGAAAKALEQWFQEERPAVGEYVYTSPETSAPDPETGECYPSYSYGYCAAAAIVDVDTETGQVYVRDLIVGDDVGKALNPQQLEGQIQGAAVQGVGYAVMEDFRQEGGIVQTRQLSTYLIPTAADIPDRVDPFILEIPDPQGPFGARGMGEMPFMAIPPVVVAAVKDAVGVSFDSFPLVPQKVLEKLQRV
ncbi:MAG: xanthine dehydrogenase family protein [Anaerolineales bacterium]|nr:xanthine dehydrogenase family protein [Anaerolineales bacterium]